MVDTTLSFASIARPLCEAVDAALDRYCRLGPGCPATLAESMRYSLLSPGKRLRPLLVLLAADACGGTLEAALPAACAVEMVHSYSLIHDDLPAMDDDDLRRGRPTNHRMFGEGVAILAGDALLARALEIVARDIQPPAVAAACCAELAQAAGPEWLVGGQCDDLSGTGSLASNADHPDAATCASGPQSHRTSRAASYAHLASIHARKTGAMLRVALRLGARTAGAAPSQIDALDRYGEKLGLAFQITDDLLDVRGDEQALGKRVGKDAQQGKLTFPAVLGVEESLEQAESLIAEAICELSPWGGRGQKLEALARYVLERDR